MLIPTTVAVALGAILAVVEALAPAAPPPYAALQRYEANRNRIAAELGDAVAENFARRLADDLFRAAEIPVGFGVADWSDTVASIARLDAEAVEQLASGAAAPLRAQPGLHEFFVPSRADGTWQALAVYVPVAAAAAAKVPLVIALHGNPQTEAELLGQPWLRRLADRTGSIVVAPFGRGIYDYAEPAATDVYDALAAVQRALPVDPARTYLLGYSMGGFSVFKVGPRGGHRWSAVMCISGAVLNSAVRSVSVAWRDVPLYVVTGAHDNVIPTVYAEQTARALAALGLPVSFYKEPRGTHALRTLVPSLERAWLDMHSGLDRPDTVPRGGSGALLQAAPPATVKT